MKKITGAVTRNVALSSTSHLLFVKAPAIAAQAIPGQFLHVLCPASGSDPLLRRPLSIANVAEPGIQPTGAAEQFALLVETVGRGTALLAAAAPGDQLDMLGPLGRGFELHPKSRQILLVAGGVGIAPLLTLAAAALAHDVAVTLLFGARDSARVFPASYVPPEVEYTVYTEDGSAGQQGLVTSTLSGLLPWADQVFACGPEGMLRAAAEVIRAARRHAKRMEPPYAQVCLEQHMACGVGACYGCVVDTAGGRKRICRDGPVFDLFEVLL